MELAEIYLQDADKTLEEIAWLVGYRSYSGFQLCFKQHFGKTPSQFRKEKTG
jgi:AraC-like DNA-binding protein